MGVHYRSKDSYGAGDRRPVALVLLDGPSGLNEPVAHVLEHLRQEALRLRCIVLLVGDKWQQRIADKEGWLGRASGLTDDILLLDEEKAGNVPEVERVAQVRYLMERVVRAERVKLVWDAAEEGRVLAQWLRREYSGGYWAEMPSRHLKKEVSEITKLAQEWVRKADLI